MTWWVDAACRDLAWGDPFYPEGAAWEVHLANRRLARVCAECPVVADCREAARETDRMHGYFGLWAGLTAIERRRQDQRAGRRRVA